MMTMKKIFEDPSVPYPFFALSGALVVWLADTFRLLLIALQPSKIQWRRNDSRAVVQLGGQSPRQIKNRSTQRHLAAVHCSERLPALGTMLMMMIKRRSRRQGTRRSNERVFNSSKIVQIAGITFVVIICLVTLHYLL